MNFDNLVAVSGWPGLYQMVANRNNGLVVEDLETGKTKFASARQHQFTPLASIGIFVSTEEDSVSIRHVFKAMQELSEKEPIIRDNAANSELVDYFGKVLPEFDRERVYPSDIKKIIKWYNFLSEKELLDLSEDEPRSEVEEE